MSETPHRPARSRQEQARDFLNARADEVRRLLSRGPRIAHLGLSNFAMSHWIPLVQDMGEQVNVANRSKNTSIDRKNGFAYPVIELWDETRARFQRITAIADFTVIKDPDHDPIQLMEAHRQIAHAFAHRDIELISLTVTAQSYFLDGDKNLDLTDAQVRECLQGPHRGTPVGILTQALLTRYRYGFSDRRFRWGRKGPSVPIAVMPLDNMDVNGEKLRRLVIQYAKEWAPIRRGFHRWLDEEVLFLNTSADRIVEESDVARRRVWLQDQLDADPQLQRDYPDLVEQAGAAMFTEPFGKHRLVIAPANIPAFLRDVRTLDDLTGLRCRIDDQFLATLDPDVVLTDQQKLRLAYPMLGDLIGVGAKFVPSVTPHRAAKRSLVNTVHMALSLAGSLAQARRADDYLQTQEQAPTPKEKLENYRISQSGYVHEVMTSGSLREFLKNVQEEFLPVIKGFIDEEIEGFPDSEIRAMGAEALERFANPQLLDELARPRRNAYDKMGEQVVPYIVALRQRGLDHERLDTILGLWLLTLTEKSRTARLYEEAYPEHASEVRLQQRGALPHVHWEAACPGVFPLRDEHASSHMLDSHEEDFYTNPLAFMEAIAPADRTTTPTTTANAFRELHHAFGKGFSDYLSGAIKEAEVLVTQVAHQLPWEHARTRDSAPDFGLG